MQILTAEHIKYGKPNHTCFKQKSKPYLFLWKLKCVCSLVLIGFCAIRKYVCASVYHIRYAVSWYALYSVCWSVFICEYKFKCLSSKDLWLLCPFMMYLWTFCSVNFRCKGLSMKGQKSLLDFIKNSFISGLKMDKSHMGLELGLQRFVDVINYVDYKNTSISMECVNASHL